MKKLRKLIPVADVKRPGPSPRALSDQEKQTYKNILTRAFAAAANFNGSEPAIQKLVEAFNHADRFVTKRAGLYSDHRAALEADFAAQSGHERRSIGDMFSGSVDAFYKGLEDDDDDAFFAALSKGGAVVINTDSMFVRPDEGEIKPPSTENPTPFEIRTDDRRTELLRGLESIGIYTDDLIIHRGKVRPNMVRKHPYTVIDIPRIGMQIAVCRQVGQVTFISNEILDPNIYEQCRKSHLKSIPGMRMVEHTSAQYWWNEIAAIIAEKTGGVTPTEKPDVKKIVRAKPRRGRPLTVLMIADAARAFVADPKNEGRRPTDDDGICEYEPCKGDTWKSFDEALRMGLRGLAGCKYKSLSKLQDGEEIGGNTLTVAMIADAARAFMADPKNKGRRPTAHDGICEYEPCEGENWGSINGMLFNGYRGLKECGYKSLSALLKGEGIYGVEKRGGARNKKAPPPADNAPGDALPAPALDMG